MKAVSFSLLAQADINRIWDHSDRHWGPDQADRYSDEIRDACKALASGLKRGRHVDVRPGYLKYAMRSHTIYFQDQGDRLFVVRILHQRQDASRNLPP